MTDISTIEIGSVFASTLKRSELERGITLTAMAHGRPLLADIYESFMSNKSDTFCIADLGSSEGIFLSEIERQISRTLGSDTEASLIDYVGVDLRRPSNKLRGIAYTIPQIRFVQGSFEQLPLATASVNYAISTWSLGSYAETKQDLVQQFSELSRILKPGGVAYITLLLKYPTLGNYITAYRPSKISDLSDAEWRDPSPHNCVNLQISDIENQGLEVISTSPSDNHTSVLSFGFRKAV